MLSFEEEKVLLKSEEQIKISPSIRILLSPSSHIHNLTPNLHFIKNYIAISKKTNTTIPPVLPFSPREKINVENSTRKKNY